MFNIEQLFPQPILNGKMPDWGICQAELMSIITANLESDLDIPEDFVNNKFICRNILDKCTITRTYIQEFLDQYATSIGINPITIEDSWITAYKKKEFIVPHNHLPKFVSGVLFIKQPKSGGKFYFDNPVQNIDNIGQHRNYTEEKNFTERAHVIEPEEGQVIVFKSFMIHGTTQVISDDQRFTLAFNAKFV